MERYNLPRKKKEKKEEHKERAKDVRLRVSVFIKKWVQQQFYDFDHNLVGRVQLFAKDTLTKVLLCPNPLAWSWRYEQGPSQGNREAGML